MKEFPRFFLVGVFNTALGYAVIFACMYWLGMRPETSNAAGYGVGLVTSFVLNRRYTFASRGHVGREFLRFVIVFGIAYGLNLGCLLLLVYALGVHAAPSQFIAGAVYVVAAFLMNKHFVFRSADDARRRA